MDVEKAYAIGSKNGMPYRAVLGWSDTGQNYYARLEADQENPETVVQFGFDRDERGNSLLMLCNHLDIEAAKLLEVEAFSIQNMENFDDGYVELRQAPRQRLVDPNSLQRLDLSSEEFFSDPGRFMSAAGTIYPDGQVPLDETPFTQDIEPPPGRQILPYEEFLRIIDYGAGTELFGEDAPIEDLEQMVADSLAELEACVCHLVEISQARQDASAETLEQQRHAAIAFTAGELVQINEGLCRTFSVERIGTIAHAYENDSATIATIYTPAEIERINRLTVALCGSKLTEFSQAIERGYDPVTGLPLGCSNPEAFRYEILATPEALYCYRLLGLSAQDAARTVYIQGTDPRYRTEDDWEFLNARSLQLRMEFQQIEERG